MKKLLVVGLVAVALTGCSGEPVRCPDSKGELIVQTAMVPMPAAPAPRPAPPAFKAPTNSYKAPTGTTYKQNKSGTYQNGPTYNTGPNVWFWMWWMESNENNQQDQCGDK